VPSRSGAARRRRPGVTADGALPEAAAAEVVALLRTFGDEPERRREVGERAAALWWRLDGAGLCGASPPEAWEEALLGLAAWHTGDDRLSRQRAGEADVAALLERLAG